MRRREEEGVVDQRARRLIVVRADAQAELERLAGRVGAALRVGRLLVGDLGGGRADERAELLHGHGVLQRALRLRRHARRDVGRARLEEAALGRAEGAGDALDGDLGLVRLAAGLGVLVVGGRRRRGRRRRGRRRRRRRAHGLHAGRVRGLLRDAAHVLALDHADVALLAPRRAPRVLDLPVVLARVGAVADDEDAVVELGAARRRVEHAALVELERRLVRLDRHRHGADRHGRLERILVLGRHVVVARVGRDRCARLLARARDARARGVRVRVLSADAVRLDPLKSVVHQAARAALVAVVVALHKVLLREGEQLAGGNLVGALHRASGGEGPARAAALLVLHRRHRALGGPVHRVRDRRADAREVHTVGVLRRLVGEELRHVGGAELVPGEVGERVVAEGVRQALGVVRVDDLVVRREGHHGLGHGIGGAVLLALLLLPRLELGEEGVAREGGRADDARSDNGLVQHD
mmetsp:Transcript_7485/g.19469  ORF Transcript_7485/g.19469 Transcript_7485/m.19469 type:complete len:469 (-) Transcript_7485:33-1439(-)